MLAMHACKALLLSTLIAMLATDYAPSRLQNASYCGQMKNQHTPLKTNRRDFFFWGKKLARVLPFNYGGKESFCTEEALRPLVPQWAHTRNQIMHPHHLWEKF